MHEICPLCGGQGFTIYAACCGRRDRHGECCGQPDPAQEPCAACDATGSIDMDKINAEIMAETNGPVEDVERDIAAQEQREQGQ